MKITVGLYQFDCREGERAGNRARVTDAARQARARGADLLALPELWCSGYDLESASAEPGWERELAFLADLSRETGIALLGGSLLEPLGGAPVEGAAGPRLANCAIACEEGEERARYRKLHLFKPLGEARWLEAGDSRPRPFLLRGVRCALSVCYDLRFPELYRPLAADGVELISVCAQWPLARIVHWRALLVARAIEAQCYVLGVNRRGSFGEIEFGGSSLLVSPSGEILVDAGEETGLFLGEVDSGAVADHRDALPVLEDRRDDLYPIGGDAR
ncbi:MAG: nitrilase-related carbon-nitrogen hydrolase [Planctomycetota bacterium]